MFVPGYLSFKLSHIKHSIEKNERPDDSFFLMALKDFCQSPTNADKKLMINELTCCIESIKELQNNEYKQKILLALTEKLGSLNTDPLSSSSTVTSSDIDDLGQSIIEDISPAVSEAKPTCYHKPITMLLSTPESPQIVLAREGKATIIKTSGTPQKKTPRTL